MKTFTIGQDLEIDIRRHMRVDGSRFPVPSPDYIADYFVITARWQGQNIDFYPNQGRPADPLAVGWVGKKVLPVHDANGNPTGATKRGADFRTRMFKAFALRLGKAILARQLNKTVKQVTQADIDATNPNSRLGRALRGNFPDPVDLTQFSIDDACRHLRDAEGDLDEGEKPPGTVANIDTTYDTSAQTGIGLPTNASLLIREQITAGQTRRCLTYFDVSSIDAGATINDVAIQVNVTTAGTPATRDIDAHAYNGTGDDDPAGDAAATQYTRMAGGTALATFTTPFATTGSKTLDLGTTADGQVEGNISSPGFWTVCFKVTGNDEGDSDSTQINLEAIENAGTDPATLIVDYTEAAGGATYPGWYGQKGGWW